ncbi:SDR family NAD(P)-dependent oxidoreductase [Geomicrobium sp. JCM 19038]|uniref:SDR family NAD(P)-dependent oxidoreductase n=1 Tax=Geomicrobium sp. JCM 19038 TaxID=1460635 RepID=UPI00045F42AE|nr:3-oxoacyl-ACP reductase FabG [Geomicrobium sp. JCM 19038]GAK07971.1 3-oxoacyl-[acyl-carrier protein] reductase [Geomicrobium sp. JCM 19038]
MKRFDTRVAVVTGASQGIGAKTAEMYALEGASVALFDVNVEKAEEVVKQIEEQGGTAIAVRCDVSNKDEVEGAMKQVAERYGRIDILVNNAGVTRDSLLFKLEEEDFDLVMDTHLKGAYLCSKAAQAYMVKQKYGKIVMLSSRSALGNRGQTNYSAAKAGLQGMARTLGIELGPFGINVNAVAPGFIETDMTKAISEKTGIPYEDVKQGAIDQNNIKRVGTPEDVANTILFLSSDQAGYVTGQVIYVAGRVVG